MEADLSHAQELRGRVANSFKRVKMFGKLIGQHCLRDLDTVFGRSFCGTDSLLHFQQDSSSSKIPGLGRSSE